MAAAFDVTAGVQSTTGNGAATTFSMSITPSSAASAVVLVVAYDASFAKAVSGTPTCGGSAMTEIGTNLTGSDGSNHLRVFRLENQPASALTVSGAWTANGSSTDSPWQCFCFAVNGAHTTNALGAGGGTTTGFGADSLAITGAATSLNVAVLMSVANNAATTTVSPGTKRYDATITFTDHLFLCAQTVAGSGSSQTMSFTPATDDQSGYRNFEIVAASAAGGGGWIGGGSRQAPSKAGPFDRRGFVLSPYQQYSYVPGVALNAYSFSADPGTYAVTGAAAGLLRAAALPALAGSYTLTGAAAKLLVGHAVNAGTATYAINGVASTDLRGLKLNASSGSYVLTGAAATLQSSHALAVNPATYALTGQSATALRGLATTVTGAYAISGASASFLIQRGVPDAPTAYAVNGGAATLIYSGSGPASRVPWQRMGLRMGL